MNNTSGYLKIVRIVFVVFSCGMSAFSQSNPSPYIDQSGQLNYSSLDFWYARKVKEFILLI